MYYDKWCCTLGKERYKYKLVALNLSNDLKKDKKPAFLFTHKIKCNKSNPKI